MSSDSDGVLKIWIIPLIAGDGIFAESKVGVIAKIKNMGDEDLEDIKVTGYPYRGFSKNTNREYANLIWELEYNLLESNEEEWTVWYCADEFCGKQGIRFLHFEFTAETSDGKHFVSCEQNAISIVFKIFKIIDPFKYYGHMMLI